MNFLYDKNSHFNLANLFTFANITFGLIAIYFITHHNFFFAALFAWLGGAFDIFDGKIARKYNLSTEFGVQLDSFADSLSFVLVPIMFIYFAIFDKGGVFSDIVCGVVLIYYFISGIRRLIVFNLKT
ncbi:MAG: phosphatidylserine synthase, partial [Epsilonproteobacteria bacterium]|nr:phosphatidylserine synthase [Campylobacterota bacterium]